MRKKCSYSEFLWSVFSRIRTEYGHLLRQSPFSVQMRENTNQKNSEYGHFSRIEKHLEENLIMNTKLTLIQVYGLIKQYPCRLHRSNRNHQTNL